MTAHSSTNGLISQFNAASTDEGDAHWRSDLVRQIAESPDKAAARATLEILLRTTGFEGAKSVSTNPYPHPGLNWRRQAWKELLNGLWTDDEAFAFADDIAARHPSQSHRMEATGFIQAHLRSHPGWSAALYRHIVDPRNADLAIEAVEHLGLGGSLFNLTAEVRPYLMRIASLEDPSYSCRAAGYLLRDHLADPEVKSCVENLLLRHPLGFEESAYNELALKFPPSTRALKIWLGILEAAETAPRARRLPLAAVTHSFRTDKELRERLFRIAQLAPLPHIRESAIGALALHFSSDRRTLGVLIGRLANDPSGAMRSRAFVWLIAQYSDKERALKALVKQLSAEADEETLRNMLKACLGDGNMGLPGSWGELWWDKNRSCNLALDEFPMRFFPRRDFQALLQKETALGAQSFILNFLRPELAPLRQHLDSYPLTGIDYDQKTRAQWERVVDQIDAMTEASQSVALLLQRFRESDDLAHQDSDREREFLARQIGEHSDKRAARSVLEELLLQEEAFDEYQERGRSNAWRNKAWELLFQDLWSEAEGVAFVRRIIVEGSDATRRLEALRHLTKGCKTRSLLIETLTRYLDDKEIGESAKNIFVHHFPEDQASYPLLLERLTKNDAVFVEHPIETLHKHFPERPEARLAIESEILRSPLRESDRFYKTYARVFPQDRQMSATLAAAAEAAIAHASKGHRNTRPHALAVFMEHFGNEPKARDIALRAARTCEARGNFLTRAGLTWLALLFHDDPQTPEILCQRLLHDRNGDIRVCAFAGLLGRFSQRKDIASLLLDRVFEDDNAEVRENLRNVIAGKGYEPTGQIYEFARLQFLRRVNNEPKLLDRVREHLKGASAKEFRAWAQELFDL